MSESLTTPLGRPQHGSWEMRGVHHWGGSCSSRDTPPLPPRGTAHREPTRTSQYQRSSSSCRKKSYILYLITVIPRNFVPNMNTDSKQSHLSIQFEEGCTGIAWANITTVCSSPWWQALSLVLSVLQQAPTHSTHRYGQQLG